MAKCPGCGNRDCTCPGQDGGGGLSPFLGLFQILSIFDWITPSKAIVDDVKHSIEVGSPLHAWTFYLPYQKSVKKAWNGRDIEKLLKQNGIKSWGHMDYFNEYLFRVDLDDAQKAERILTKAGVPLKDSCRGAPKGRR
jgi:hypothetical protein